MSATRSHIRDIERNWAALLVSTSVIAFLLGAAVGGVYGVVGGIVMAAAP